MKKVIYIAMLLLLALVIGCKKDDGNEFNSDAEGGSTIVEVLDDGTMRVYGSLASADMADVSVSSRAATVDETTISSGWCLIFGEAQDEIGKGSYSNDSPLLMIKPLQISPDGSFFVTLPKYSATAFMRVVTNLTTRETKTLEDVSTWSDDEDNIYSDAEGMKCLKTYDATTDLSGIGTFGQYVYQSVGLDGIYNISSYSTTISETGETETDVNGTESYKYENINEVAPNPTSDTSPAIPMSSVGFVLSDISVETLQDIFENVIYMVRVCSKVDVRVDDATFTLSEIHLIDCAQESRIRSTVLSTSSTDGANLSPTWDIPVNLGGSISYKPLVTLLSAGDISSPIYFYPNSGGYYSSNGGAVDQTVNPQYVVIKGRASGYDTDGYYKVALKAQYPLSYNYDDDGNITTVKEWSDLTYDILRNTYFTVSLSKVDKPGYKTLADAIDDDNPASNISYSITITSEDGRNEILVSNGSYSVELQTTRVYMAGYGYDGCESNIVFTMSPNSSGTGYYHPAAYVQADYYVNITECSSNDSIISEIDLEDPDILAALFDSTNVKYYDKDIALAYGDTTTFKEALYNDSDEVHDKWFKVPSSNAKSEVNVKFKATASGRIRLRIGDMLKFIPVAYDKNEVSGAENQLEIEDEDYFGYDQLISLIDGTDSFSWFSNKGMVEKNESGATRELQAKLYPSNADGITKLFFKQAKYSTPIIDTDARDEADTDVLRDGNVVYLNGLNGDTYTDVDDAADQIVSMLDEGYTTIYFEGSNNTLNIGDILDAVADQTSATFAIDLLDVTGGDFSQEDFDDNSIFQNNKNITSVVLPSAIKKLTGSIFSGCTNLKVVIIGAVDDPSSNCDSIEEVFTGCTSLETVIVYTKSESVQLKAQSNCTDWFTKQLDYSYDDDDEVVKITGTGAAGYFFIFGDDTDFTDSSGNYNSELYTMPTTTN